MRALIQRVSQALVSIEGEEHSAIGQGYLILLGVGQEDSEEQAQRLWSKISRLRIFYDDQGKTNLSIQDVEGQVLVVSQFTLYADCKKGNRPSFGKAGDPGEAQRLYGFFCDLARQDLGDERVGTGSFGADMQVSLINDGPFTIWLDTDSL